MRMNKLTRLVALLMALCLSLSLLAACGQEEPVPQERHWRCRTMRR